MVKKNYKQLLVEAKKLYKSIGKVYCPVLKEEVVFNAKGFRHLRYKSTGEERSVKEQSHKLHLLPYLKEAIQEVKEITDYRIIEDKNCSKKIEFWSLGKMINGYFVKVILKRIGNGNITFLSIMKKKKPPQQTKRSLESDLFVVSTFSFWEIPGRTNLAVHRHDFSLANKLDSSRKK